MTLVLGVLTHEYVVQVSDRRVTSVSDGTLLEDDRNKATVFCGHMAFAYSGLAEIDRQRTDVWLAKVIAPSRTLQETHERLSEAATNAFKTISLPSRTKRHAFCGIGWAQVPWATGLVPGQSIISNALDQAAWADEARDTFAVTGVGLSQKKNHRLLPPIGAALRRPEMTLLDRNVRRCVERKTGALEVVRLIGEAIRRVSFENSRVGRSLLAIVIPKPSDAPGIQMFLTPVAPSGFNRIDHPMFFHIPADSTDLDWNMPNYVCGGVVMQGRFEQG